MYPRFSANYLHTDEEAGQERVGGGRGRHGSQLFNGSMTAAGRMGVFLLGPPTSFSISPQLQLPFHPGTSCFSCRWGGERPRCPCECAGSAPLAGACRHWEKTQLKWEGERQGGRRRGIRLELTRHGGGDESFSYLLAKQGQCNGVSRGEGGR